MRKKLFAILMSAMMMVTFMPAMAFAAAAKTIEWAPDYTYAIVNGQRVGVERTIDTTGTWDGQIDVTADISEVQGVDEAPTTYYYDLSGAKPVAIVIDSADPSKDRTDIKFGSLDWTSFQNLFKDTDSTVAVKLQFTAPSYLGAKAGTKSSAVTPVYGTAGTSVNAASMTTPYYDANNKFEAQTFSLAVSLAKITNTLGTIPAKTIICQKKTADDSDVAFSFAGTTPASKTVEYDGAEHVVAVNTVPGYTFTGYKHAASTGAVETLTEVKLKDAVSAYVVTPLYKLTGDTTDREFAPQTFKINSAAAELGVESLEIAASANIADQFVVKGSTGATDAKTAANKAAVKADAELLKAYFNDFYDVTTVANEKAETVTAQVTFKKIENLTAAEKDALVAKYSTLLANYGKNVSNINRAWIENKSNALFAEKRDVVFQIVAKDIEWTKAPLVKTFKAKKLKKAAKSFKVEAKADAKVTYKLQNGGSAIKINKTTGEITVKKGLKKGTYKVYVTASAKSAVDKTVSDTYVMKIKVVK